MAINSGIQAERVVIVRNPGYLTITVFELGQETPKIFTVHSVDYHYAISAKITEENLGQLTMSGEVG